MSALRVSTSPCGLAKGAGTGAWGNFGQSRWGSTLNCRDQADLDGRARVPWLPELGPIAHSRARGVAVDIKAQHGHVPIRAVLPDQGAAEIGRKSPASQSCRANFARGTLGRKGVLTTHGMSQESHCIERLPQLFPSPYLPITKRQACLRLGCDQDSVRNHGSKIQKHRMRCCHRGSPSVGVRDYSRGCSRE